MRGIVAMLCLWMACTASGAACSVESNNQSGPTTYPKDQVLDVVATALGSVEKYSNPGGRDRDARLAFACEPTIAAINYGQRSSPP